MGVRFWPAAERKAVRAFLQKLHPNKPLKGEKPKGFSRVYRITSRSDFDRIRKNAQKLVFRHWILFYCRNEIGVPRLALSISGKYGNSVARNFMRRWFRETFRLHKNALKPLDFHFIARQRPTKCSKKRYREELNADFQKLLHRFG